MRRLRPTSSCLPKSATCSPSAHRTISIFDYIPAGSAGMLPVISMNLIDHLRTEARLAPESGISALANRGRGRPGVIPLWVGEGDLPTPTFIADAATHALQ